MTARIQTLIEGPDHFELVRDKVSLILAEESVAQQALATLDGKDPEGWRLRVFIERSNPWEFLRTDDGRPPADRAPVVCVWFDTSNIDEKASQQIDRQQYNMVLNLDVYGIGVTEILTDGQRPGDEMAVLEAQRAARLVRNILMSDSYTTLGFAPYLGVVGQRTVSGITSFQPEFANQNAAHVSAVRLTLQVKVSENGPQTPAVILEELSAIVKNGEGEVVVDALFL